MPSIKLTQTAVKEIEADPMKQLLFRDTEVRGLALRVTPNGHKTFVFGYSVNGRERRMRIGDASTCTVAEAREAAKKLRREVENGSDPQEQRLEKANAPSMKELWDAFQTDHFPDISEKYRTEQVSYWDRHVLPAFGKLKVADLKRQDVVALHRKIAEGAPTLANRVLASIRKALSYAITRGWIQDNVASKIKQKRETKRKRYLSPEEMERVASALHRMPNRKAAAAISLLFLTGARRSEVLGARWQEFDMPREGSTAVARWNKPADRTKTRTDMSIPLTAEAVEVLRILKAEQDPQSEFLFPTKSGTPMQDVNGPWKWLLQEADLTDFRLHDLRHSYASILISNGFDLPVVGHLLGHSQPQTTARYAHLMDGAQQAATAVVGSVWKNLAPPADTDG